VKTMQRLAIRLGLTYGVDVVGMDSIMDLITHLGETVGRYDAAVTFDSLPTWCTEWPCDDVTEEEKAERIAAAEYAAQMDATRKPINLNGIPSCPILTPLTETYTLWLNSSWNGNDPVPSWVTQQQPYQSQTISLAVPPRYWALQQVSG
jgi:hypothetical protein